MPADSKKPTPPAKAFDWRVDNPLAGPIGGTVHAPTAADAERLVRDWLAAGLTVTPADRG